MPASQEDYGRLFSLRQLEARGLGSIPTLYELIKQGELESLKVRKYRKITERSVNRYIARRLAAESKAT
jgi:excisionase family DNA binding protein